MMCNKTYLSVHQGQPHISYFLLVLQVIVILWYLIAFA